MPTLPESRRSGQTPDILTAPVRRISVLLMFSLLMAPTVVLGQVTINEIMQNPSAVSDGNGEWFEIYNAGGSPVDIDGWTFRDDGSGSLVADGEVVTGVIFDFGFESVLPIPVLDFRGLLLLALMLALLGAVAVRQR